MRIYFDIETVPSQAPEARELARAGVRPPANYKKPETITEWWKAEGELATETAYRKQALDGAAGELCALGFATDDIDPVSLVRGLDEPEADFLNRAMTAINDLIESGGATGPDGACWPETGFFVGHNTAFDLGFLLRRCWARGIRPPFPIPGPSARAGKDFGCSMTLWGGPRDTISLDHLCRALGVQSPKDGITGAEVFDLWRSGDHDRLAAYNRGDVAATRACWYRLNWEVIE